MLCSQVIAAGSLSMAWARLNPPGLPLPVTLRPPRVALEE